MSFLLKPIRCMVKKRKRLFIKQVPVTHYRRTPLRTARSLCTPSQVATRAPVKKLGPGQLPSVGLQEDDWQRKAQGLRSSLRVPLPLQNVGVEGDSGASGVVIGLVGGSRAVGRGKVAGSGVRAPSSAVKNSLAGCRFPAAGGESFLTRPKTSILHDPRGIPNRSELAGEADVDTADLLCGGARSRAAAGARYACYYWPRPWRERLSRCAACGSGQWGRPRPRYCP
eukprot:COSAG05_NODE_2178_length_3433_cov_77.463707_5_plen_226_part_00